MRTLRRGPCVIGIWLVLAGLVIVIVAQQASKNSAPVEPAIPLLSIGEDGLGSIEMLHQARRAAVSRDSEGQWFVHTGNHSHADGAVQTDETHHSSRKAGAVLAGHVAATAAIRVRPAEDESRPEDVGVVNPKTIVAFYGRSGREIDYDSPLAMLYVGDHAPDLEAFFATIDDDQTVTLVDEQALTALIGLLFSARP
jgi:hypothetical protein|tara:strand:- start:57 stop:647 length:591 start_codon:yes stop_codon:yes gene_type:complete